MTTMVGADYSGVQVAVVPLVVLVMQSCMAVVRSKGA